MHKESHSEPSVTFGSERHPPKLKRLALIASIVALGVVAAGIAIRMHNTSSVKQWTDERAVSVVRLVSPERSESPDGLTLPGNLQAYIEAPIFARVSGYLKRWNVDIGAQVKAGQLLAEIDTPELDEQLAQARADLTSAQSNEKLAEITAKRWQNLRMTDSVSQQEADQKASDLAAKTAAVAAAQANVSRIQALESFKRILAPFDGIVTARKTDIGSLINAGSGTGVELFRVADVKKLRLYVNVPQIYAAKIKPGMTAYLSVPERPGERFAAVLKRTSGAISAASGTLLTELEVDNKDGLMTPGGYAEVKFDLAADKHLRRLPASCLVLRKGGVHLATVDKDNRVTLKKVEVGLDFGTEVEILSGLDANDRVIDSPPDSIEAGDVVRVEKDSEPGKQAQAAASARKGNE